MYHENEKMRVTKAMLKFRILILGFVCMYFSQGCTNGTKGLENDEVIDTVMEQPRPASGLLFYGKQVYAEDTTVIANPNIVGGFFQIIWSEVEKAEGQYDWDEVDGWIEPWVRAGKHVALRVMWSTSGYWCCDYYKRPTPQWVWDKGAKYAYHAPSETEIPLVWDPIYKEYAFRFLEEVARKFDGNVSVLFVDVTPGAETNPYRFGTIDKITPEFREEFLNTSSSDQKVFSEDIWFTAVEEWIDTAATLFVDLPLLITLNVGNMPEGSNQLDTNGDHAAGLGYYVGQNGLHGDTPLRENFVDWSRDTKVFFEMVDKSGGSTGTLMEVMEAAVLNHASYLNVYPEDVRAGTIGSEEYDAQFEEALKYGASVIGKGY